MLPQRNMTADPSSELLFDIVSEKFQGSIMMVHKNIT